MFPFDDVIMHPDNERRRYLCNDVFQWLGPNLEIALCNVSHDAHQMSELKHIVTYYVYKIYIQYEKSV